MSVLPNTPEGREALAANYKVTGGIQNGSIHQPTLLPFALQQQQALQDVFITGSNLAQLSDGLGTTLGSAYLARAHYNSYKSYTKLSDTIQKLIAFSQSTSGKHATAGKYYFANGTTNGKTAVTQEALDFLTQIKGQTDVFGKAYGFPLGKPGAGSYGNARPFQTETSFIKFSGLDYFNVASTNLEQDQKLNNSPSYPSGHTTYCYTGVLLLALLVPERYQQLITRGAEYGNDRIIMGAHYTMDVLSGRTLAMYDMAHLLANDPAYTSNSSSKLAIHDFRAAVVAARIELKKMLEDGCGNKLEICAGEDTGRFNNPTANEAFYMSTQTYNLGVVYPKLKDTTEDIGKLAPEAGYLLTVAFPSLSLEEANKILTETEGPGGGFLDNGSAFGVYSRLNLYAAAGRAAKLVASK